MTDERDPPEGDNGLLRLRENLQADFWAGTITLERDTGETGCYATPTHTVVMGADEFDRLAAWVCRMREKEGRGHAGE